MFNKGVYDYFIATDESRAHGEHDKEEGDKEGEREESEEREDECLSYSSSNLSRL